jgi:hypothetical protein
MPLFSFSASPAAAPMNPSTSCSSWIRLGFEQPGLVSHTDQLGEHRPGVDADHLPG